MKYVIVFLILFVSIPSLARYRQDFWIPQTHTLEAGVSQANLGRNATLSKDATTSQHTSMLGFSVGIWEKDIIGVEGGLEWEEPAVEMVTRGIYGHLRIRANDIEKSGWAFALGIEKLGFVSNKNDFNMIYLVLQNKFSEKWIVGVGGYNGSSRFLIDENGKDDPRGAFLGVWRQIQQGRGRIGAEYQSGRNLFGYAFAGFTLELSDFVYGTLGYGFANNANLVKDWVLARVSVDF